MGQLKFDNTFDNFIDDISYWQSKNDIPLQIIDFIKYRIGLYLIYDNNSGYYYCPNCFNVVSNLLYCKDCSKRYNTDLVIDVDNIREACSKNIKFNCYAFDVVCNQVFLYLLEDSIYLYNPNCYKPYIIHDINIKNVYYICKNGVLKLDDKSFYLYSEYKKQCYEIYSDDNNDMSDNKYSVFQFFSHAADFVYLDNISLLKDTIYKYSFIWDSICYLKNHYIYLDQLTYLPLYNKSFEYLIKYRLYNLAYCDINYQGDFKKTFGVSKEYLSFMIDNDITNLELRVLKILNVKDINIVRELANYDYIYILETIYAEYKIDILKLKEYFDNNKLDYQNFYEYYDYISIAKKLGLNLKNRKVLFPLDLIYAHDMLCRQYEEKNDPYINDKIKNIGKLLEINEYEDNDYIIRPAKSLDDLYNESREQNNCVRTYCQRIINGECQIYFMRKKACLNKSLVTIEVRDNKVVQARMKNNYMLDSQLANIIKKWGDTIIPIKFN